jgi:hypothetical protein
MTQPSFISWLRHGAINLAPPGVFRDATAYAFVLDASSEAMQGLVDKLLAPATQGKFVYRVATAATMVSVLDIEQCSSGAETSGWLPGREFAIWVPLIEENSEKGTKRLVLWSPYIFINYDIGMVTGREVWGWPKAMAQITVEPTAQPARLSCKTTIFRTLTPQTMGSVEELIAISGTKPITPGAGDLIELLSTLFGDMAIALAELFHVEPVIPAIALKQMRDSADVTRAVYQAIVNSPCRVTKMKGGEVIDDQFTLSITNCESHSIMQDIFGEKPTEPVSQRKVTLASRIWFDFQADPGAAIIAWP